MSLGISLLMAPISQSCRYAGLSALFSYCRYVPQVLPTRNAEKSLARQPDTPLPWDSRRCGAQARKTADESVAGGRLATPDQLGGHPPAHALLDCEQRQLDFVPAYTRTSSPDTMAQLFACAPRETRLTMAIQMHVNWT